MASTLARTKFGDKLTKREHQVIGLIAKGMLTKQIADEWGVAFKTVDTYRATMMRKTGLHGVADVTRYAILHGYVEAAYGNGRSTNGTGS